MSFQNLVYVTTVPFNIAGVDSLDTSMVGSKEFTKAQSNDFSRYTACVQRTVPQLGNSKDGSLRIIKKKQNLFKNKADAHAFREKTRLKRELLEKEVLNLKLDKMRLLWENDQLKIRQSCLEEENLSLKRRLEDSQSHQHEDAASWEDTLKHASFINNPQPKDRVLPQMFALLMMLLGGAFNNLQMKSYLTFQLSSICRIVSKHVKSAALPITARRQTMCLYVP